ncbi:MAG: 2Fe-2S iron-sulfur cluster-binding protein [Burkholderiales bacterium]
MPKVTFIIPDGAPVELDVAVGTSLMQAATAHGIASIAGDCGGAMSCATCHIFIEAPFDQALAEVSETESQMLEYTASPRQPNSRLSCQVMMSEQFDGMTVRVADPQT